MSALVVNQSTVIVGITWLVTDRMANRAGRFFEDLRCNVSPVFRQETSGFNRSSERNWKEHPSPDNNVPRSRQLHMSGFDCTGIDAIFGDTGNRTIEMKREACLLLSRLHNLRWKQGIGVGRAEQKFRNHERQLSRFVYGNIPWYWILKWLVLRATVK